MFDIVLIVYGGQIMSCSEYQIIRFSDRCGYVVLNILFLWLEKKSHIQVKMNKYSKTLSKSIIALIHLSFYLITSKLINTYVNNLDEI